MSELVGKLSQGVEYYKGERGPKGEKGEAFKYEDFTPEQLEQLRGPKGDDGFIKFEELTPESFKTLIDELNKQNEIDFITKFKEYSLPSIAVLK